jgi:hypothetical protein
MLKPRRDLPPEVSALEAGDVVQVLPRRVEGIRVGAGFELVDEVGPPVGDGQFGCVARLVDDDGLEVADGGVEDVVGVLSGSDAADGPGGDLEDAAELGGVADDSGVPVGIGADRDAAGEPVQVVPVAAALEETALGELGSDGDGVDFDVWLAVDLEDRSMDVAVGFPVVVTRAGEGVDSVVDGAFAEEHAAEKGLLGGDVAGTRVFVLEGVGVHAAWSS